MEFRTRPKSDYLLNADWQELYILTEHWNSDIDFFLYELSFLETLFDKNFSHLFDNENSNEAKISAGQLVDLKARHKKLQDRIRHHLIHITQFLKNSAAQDESQFRNEHVQLEDELTDFVKRFREVKHKIFKLVERISKSEKGKHLLQS
jgi:hypothetical protein